MIGKKINQLATELAPTTTDLTIIGDPVTGVSKKITLEQLGAIFGGAVSFYTTLGDFPATGVIDIIYCAKDTQKLYLWSGSAYVEVFPSQALLNTYQLRSEKGVSNGYASLDVNGKVPIGQLPNSIMEYKGTWNAATNTPTLANGTGDTGDVYICNAAGTVNFGAGPITFAVGDYVVYSGTIWQRSSGAVGTVTSVAVSRSGDALAITGSPITTSGTINLGFAGTSGQYINGAGSLTTFPTLLSSVGLSMPSAFSVANSPLTANGTIAVTGAGNATQYVRGDGQLATLPTNGSGGGASVSYYLNGSVNQGTIGGVTYYEMNKTPIIGAGTDFSRSSNGYIASFLTDANDPALLNIPAGNFNFETYFQASSGGGSPTFYIELYKYDGTTFTLIASNSATPKLINDGVNIEAYFSALAVPQTTLTLTDRLAVRIYVTTAGRTITLHTENGHLCQVITTFTTGLTALNGLTSQVQYLATGTSGTDFNISSATATHTFNLPTASATNRGALSSADWTTFNSKQNALSGTGFVKISGTTISYDNSTYYLASNPNSYIALTNLSAGAGISYNNTTGVITSTITQYTDALGRAAISLTTTGTSGAATYNNTTGVLNIPQYQTALTNPVTGTGTTNYLPKFTGTSTIGNSIVQETSGFLLTDKGTSTMFGVAIATSSSNGGNLTIKAGGGFGAGNSAGNLYLAFGRGNSSASNGAMYFGLAQSTDAVGLDTTYMTLNASGNLGLGVTPSAWSTSFGIKVIDVGSKGTFYASDNDANISFNQYFDGTNAVYKTTGTASRFALVGNEFQWRTAPSGTAGNAISFTQAMTLDASGRLGIGTTSPTFRFDVETTNLTVGRFYSNAAGTRNNILIQNSGNYNYGVIGVVSATGGISGDVYALGYSASGSTAMTPVLNWTSGGNVGIGTTSPVAADGSAKTLQLGNRLVIQNVIGTQFLLSTNAYYDGTWKYIAAAKAQAVRGTGESGAIQFSLSPTGTSGGTITNMDGSDVKMIILESGNVGIGTTTPTRTFQVNGYISSFDGTTRTEIVNGGGVGFFGTQTTHPLAFQTDNVERMRITSGGLIGMGVTSPSEKLHLRDTTTGYVGLRLEGSSSYAGSDWTIYASSTSPSSANDFLGFYNNSTTDSATAEYKFRLFKTGVAEFVGDVKVKTLEVTNVTTYGSSAGISTYMQITVNGNNYVIPLHQTP